MKTTPAIATSVASTASAAAPSLSPADAVPSSLSTQAKHSAPHPTPHHADPQRELRGLLLGLLGVALFAATLPMTKLAVGSQAQPQLSPWFVTFGRAAAAGFLALAYLLVQHQLGRLRRPVRSQWGLIALTAAGVIVGFPLFMALALVWVHSTHGAVVTGLLPLTTAVVAALWYGQRPSLGFWLSAVSGTLLVLAFMVVRALDAQGQVQLHLADVFLLLAMVCGAFGYVGGARLTPSLGAEGVICWVLVLALPITVPLALWNLPTTMVAIHGASWWAFAYVSVISMWLGFFAWYRGLELGGAVRVSQVQLLQPFISLIIAMPLLGEQIDSVTLGFAFAVIVTVFIGKKMPVTTNR